jgi:hypothetical protein
MSDFQTSPGYQFRLDEGTRNLENRFSVKGGGGNAMRALNEYNQNFASNEFGNWWNRQAGLSGVGQAATGQTAYAGMNAANNISGQYGMIGDNLSSIGLRASANSSNNLNAGISNLLYGLKGSWGGSGTKSGGRSSDVRLKENIHPIGELLGLNIYSWVWKDESITEPTVGVLAQEVQKTHPEAVYEKDGYLMVDYSMLFGD